MSRTGHNLGTVAFLARHRAYGEILTRLLKLFYSNSVALGMQRDLESLPTSPSCTLPLRLRPIRPEDVGLLFDVLSRGVSREEAHGQLARLHLLKLGLPSCYVAVQADDTPCYVQWAVRSSDNERLGEVFPSWFPRLRDDEVLLEYAYTVPKYRRSGIMNWALEAMGRQASSFGARWLLSFIPLGNRGSIEGHIRAGFRPYLLRVGKSRPFSRSVRFLPLGTGDVSAAGLIDFSALSREYLR